MMEEMAYEVYVIAFVILGFLKIHHRCLMLRQTKLISRQASII